MSRSSPPDFREPSMPGMKGSMAARPMAAPLPGMPRDFHISPTPSISVFWIVASDRDSVEYKLAMEFNRLGPEFA